ncbi:MAG: DUF2281 domain-containing protein [Thermodesulfobacteriota bacterium]|jgi:hypothetical protein
MEPQRRRIEELLEQLPAESQSEVLDFAEFLLQRAGKRHRTKPCFSWAGALENLGEHTSVGLQHEIARCRAGEP